jgi:hypothetical protein
MLSRVLMFVGLVLFALGAVPWMLSKKAAIHDVHGLIGIIPGCALIVMAWCEVGANLKRSSAMVLLWSGVALGIAGWAAWEFNQQSPEHKLSVFAFPMIPGWSLAVMGYCTLAAHRRAAPNVPPAG